MKKGFASITIIYSFLILFILTLLSLLAIYTQKSRLVDSIVNEAKTQIINFSDINFPFPISGNRNSFIIDANNRLFGWGKNKYSVLGFNSSTEHFSNPTLISNIKFKDVIALGTATLAIDTEGNLYSWGANMGGQLGNGGCVGDYYEYYLTVVPTLINTNVRFKKLAGYGGHVLALDVNGNLYTWGSNYMGQLGNGSYSRGCDGCVTTPTQIMIGTKFQTISAGNSHSLAIDTEGNLYSWGDNEHGQTGDGTTNEYTPTYTPVLIASGTKFQAISLQDYVCYAIDENGNLYGWGFLYENYPTIINSETKFKALSSGFAHTLALSIDGKVYGIGSNRSGELLVENSTWLSNFQVIYDTNKIKSIHAGSSHSLILDESNNLYTFGNTYYGDGSVSYDIPLTLITLPD